MINETQKTLVLTYYIITKMSANKIADILNINVKSVYKILKEKDVKIRTISEASMKYTCNETFFSIIDCEEKAYWLGVLYADGNISKKASKSGQIFFTSKDKEWVEDFLKAIKSTNNPRCEVHAKFGTNIWKAQVTSSQMFNDLFNLGCVPVKSFIIRLPIIHNDLIHHFIRGYFDGDGTVGVYKNTSLHDWKILKSGFCSGSKAFLEDILEILPVKNKKITYNGVYINQLSLNDSRLLYTYLYKNSTVCLKRKEDIFIEYFKSYSPRKRFNDYNRPSL